VHYPPLPCLRVLVPRIQIGLGKHPRTAPHAPRGRPILGSFRSPRRYKEVEGPFSTPDICSPASINLVDSRGCVNTNPTKAHLVVASRVGDTLFGRPYEPGCRSARACQSAKVRCRSALAIASLPGQGEQIVADTTADLKMTERVACSLWRRGPCHKVLSHNTLRNLPCAPWREGMLVGELVVPGIGRPSRADLSTRVFGSLEARTQGPARANHALATKTSVDDVSQMQPSFLIRAV
jgi:hypothetical protein